MKRGMWSLLIRFILILFHCLRHVWNLTLRRDQNYLHALTIVLSSVVNSLASAPSESLFSINLKNIFIVNKFFISCVCCDLQWRFAFLGAPAIEISISPIRSEMPALRRLTGEYLNEFHSRLLKADSSSQRRATGLRIESLRLCGKPQFVITLPDVSAYVSRCACNYVTLRARYYFSIWYRPLRSATLTPRPYSFFILQCSPINMYLRVRADDRD